MGFLVKCFTEFLPLFSSSPFFSYFPLLFIDEEGGYSSNDTKRPIPWVTGLVHLIKLHLYREQLSWTWQDKVVATVNSLLGVEKAGEWSSELPRTTFLSSGVAGFEGRVYLARSPSRQPPRGWITFGDPQSFFDAGSPSRGFPEAPLLLAALYLRGYRIEDHLR